MSTTPKTLMTDKDVDKLRANGYEAEHELLDARGVRMLGVAAQVAADAIVALREQSAALLADATAWRSFGDAAGVLKREAESLSKSVNVDEYAAALAESREKAQRWDAAHAALRASPPAPADGGVRVGDEVSNDSVRGKVLSLIGRTAMVQTSYGARPIWHLEDVVVVKRAPPKPSERWRIDHTGVECVARGQNVHGDNFVFAAPDGEPRYWNCGSGWTYVGPGPGPAASPDHIDDGGGVRIGDIRDSGLFGGHVTITAIEGGRVQMTTANSCRAVHNLRTVEQWPLVRRGPAEAASAPVPVAPDGYPDAATLEMWSKGRLPYLLDEGSVTGDVSDIARCVTALVAEVRRNERMRHECMMRQSERLSRLEAGNE